MSEEKKSSEKIADAVYFAGSAYVGIYVVAFVAFFLFVAYVLIMPASVHYDKTVPVQPVGVYTQTREITVQEVNTYWNRFCNECNDKGYPGDRWHDTKWTNNDDFKLCQSMWFQFLAQRGLRQPRN